MQTIIDNFLYKLTESTLNTTSGILIKMFSYHQPYFILLNTIKHKIRKPKYIKLIKQDTESIQGFHQEIFKSAKHLIINSNYDMHSNINYNVLHEIIQQAKTKNMPEKPNSTYIITKYPHGLQRKLYDQLSIKINYIKTIK